MMIFTEDMLNELSEVFPELTPAQIEVAMMYSSGMPIADISGIRKTSQVNTRKILKECVSAMNISSMNVIYGVIQSRLSICLLKKINRLETFIIECSSLE